MASTAATVFFWRFGSASRSAVLIGFWIWVGAGGVWAEFVWAVAAAASNSVTGIHRAFFMLSSDIGERFGKKNSAGDGLRASWVRALKIWPD
jgi:hypothetical protein